MVSVDEPQVREELLVKKEVEARGGCLTLSNVKLGTGVSVRNGSDRRTLLRERYQNGRFGRPS